ncbi:hypothetical protein M407DRAFT_8910 [Tulasnella calospora MUT 4182]|uniref:Uncharacterized protein n=1 Tax=Tulasnella calospora MUT 4182 TaxID=1051891 RepID=A0A0C3QGA6_9AGAM|nr:hypothetical protein M407DRAFT_8910 [Tulasnella calospora MUT 4182]
MSIGTAIAEPTNPPILPLEGVPHFYQVGKGITPSARQASGRVVAPRKPHGQRSSPLTQNAEKGANHWRTYPLGSIVLTPSGWELDSIEGGHAVHCLGGVVLSVQVVALLLEDELILGETDSGACQSWQPGMFADTSFERVRLNCVFLLLAGFPSSQTAIHDWRKLTDSTPQRDPIPPESPSLNLVGFPLSTNRRSESGSTSTEEPSPPPARGPIHLA